MQDFIKLQSPNGEESWITNNPFVTKLELLKHFETTGDQVQSSLEDHIDDFVERIHSRLTDPLRQRIQNIRRELHVILCNNNNDNNNDDDNDNNNKR